MNLNRHIQMKPFFILAVFLIFFSSGNCQKSTDKPNIVLIYIDDLGYGDIGVNGAKGVKTPNIDYLANNGLNFTDAHSTAATCTPSRYSLLTGQYAFRNKAQILEGDAPLIIDPNRRTLADILQDAGYTTGIVGKWHLGLGAGNVDWNKRVSPGPAELGFDYSFLIPATGDRVPTVFLENQFVANLDPEDPITINYGKQIPGGYPTGRTNPELLKQYADNYHLSAVTNGISRIGYMKGGEKALWVDEKIPFVLTTKATDFIDKNKNNPFFLMYSFHDIHQPRIANVKFIGSSSMGPRGDVIAQMDWAVGEVTKKLQELGLEEKTLIIFTSDNGPILDDGYLDYARELVGDHKPGGPYKGSKYVVYEAGTRMPTICYWPGVIKPGTSQALLSQVDLYASLADLVGQKLKNEDAPDSQAHWDAWAGKTNTARTYLLEEAYNYALRKDHWKYIQPKENATTPGWMTAKFVDPGFLTQAQLFDLKNDPGETRNVSNDYPELVEELEKQLSEIFKNPSKTK
ncbi:MULTISPECIES: sulfatase-like hydrolase/transferase [unclassified Leeuwenhoekiella]|uniref:sulfatase-like hydrolase/transferase n=1 Tax=unclassified Leeuwenhoekiella TaxID=2615029 RepID=UPI000C616E32|nr:MULTISPECIES: sulfatase-like hydrolase/transferase [unclassified Leeuwenhoekiella]MAW94349.1 arylsulfatase [Leeuwenhoekiella sp.]MBA81025.1 arylsulfatase [Leeuwenhoekiella sp.]